jgi:hypothetical protein
MRKGDVKTFNELEIKPQSEAETSADKANRPTTIPRTRAFESDRFNARGDSLLWIQPWHYRRGPCTVSPPAGIIVKDNGISRSDSDDGGGGGGSDR